MDIERYHCGTVESMWWHVRYAQVTAYCGGIHRICFLSNHSLYCIHIISSFSFCRNFKDKLDIKWDPKKFRFESLRAIFEDAEIKKICRLDNASSTALVSTPEKSKEIPTMEFIKNGFVQVLLKYDPHQEGYRMKKKGKKGSDLRAHFASVTGKALKPKMWFGCKVKDLIRECNDVIEVDPFSEEDGVWKLFLK